MLLHNLMLIGTDKPVSVQVKGSKIAQVFKTPVAQKHNEPALDFDGALIFPGLINSHDHLDFNLFPMLGKRVYADYTEWGRYIHENYRDEIAKVLNVPVMLRAQWGMFKNLICGVTTVVNHGNKLTIPDPVINLYERCYCIHSVQFEKSWKRKLNHPLTRRPVVIHTGEGTSQASRDEINQLIHWNLLQKKLVGVHGVAMSARQADRFRALVWCPESNFFLLNTTAAIKELKQCTSILFGTDSTLTGGWNIWEHIRLARKTQMLTDAELYAALTANAAAVWKTGSKAISSGEDADMVIAKPKNGLTPIEAFFNLNPEDILLVMHKGSIRMFDASLHKQLQPPGSEKYSRISINGHVKYIEGNLPGLLQSIKEYYPEADFPVAAVKEQHSFTGFKPDRV